MQVRALRWLLMRLKNLLMNLPNLQERSSIGSTVEQQAACLEDVFESAHTLSNLAVELDEAVKMFKL